MAATMPLAAMITIGHRLPLMLEAMSGAQHDPEIRRMTDEKVRAAGQATSVLGAAMVAGQQAIVDYVLAETRAGLALLARPPRSPDDVHARASASIERATDLAETLGEIGSRAIAAGMRPAHRSVTANARRLAAQRRRR